MVTEDCLESTVKWESRIFSLPYIIMSRAFSVVPDCSAPMWMAHGTRDFIWLSLLKDPQFRILVLWCPAFLSFSDHWQRNVFEDNISWDFDFMAIFRNLWHVASWNSDRRHQLAKDYRISEPVEPHEFIWCKLLDKQANWGSMIGRTLSTVI